MPVTQAELESFARFAAIKIGNGGAELTLEALVRQWNEEREMAETVADIQRGIRDYEEGKGIPLDDAFNDVRKRLGIPD
jgi:hypothetical protein